MVKKYLAVLFAVCITASALSACTQTEINIFPETTGSTTQFITDDENFKLSYTQSDSLDPFKAKTQNNQVLESLVFESLFDLDESYAAQLNIATGYEYTNKKTLKVTIGSTLHFSNGSELTADDVAYSFRAAAKSPAYGTALVGIKSASAQSGNTIIFNLAYENPYAINLLTFPITSTSNDKDGYPIGSGRYSYKSTSRGLTLQKNDPESFSPHITTIHLVNIAAADSIDNAVNIGNISFAFRDMSENTVKRITAAKKAVNLNNLVYVGVNNKSGITANENIRRAISLALDRQTIAKSAYSGYATPAGSLFNPAFELSDDTRIFSVSPDTSAAKQAIAQSGYETKNLTLTLLYNKNPNKGTAAKLIEKQLELVGFKVKLEEVSYKTYKDRLEKNNFDIFLGETKLSNDMNLNVFLSEDGNLRYGIDKDSVTANHYSKYLSGEEELGKFILSFNEEMPYIPVLYKKGMICYSKALNGDMQGYSGNYFLNIDDWYFE